MNDATFVTHVADFHGDVGAGLSLTTDAEGNPHMAYLAFEEEQAPGAATPTAATGPELPAVKHAHLVGGAWTRSVVAEGVGAARAGAEFYSDVTGIAVDGNGVHHVVWTEQGSVVYANNAKGAFSEPETISDEDAIGASVALAADGTPWIAFYEQTGGTTETDVATPIVRVATPEENGWAAETAAEASVSWPEARTAIAFSRDQPLVAYGSEERTLVATRSGDLWRSEEADADGGFGVSVSVDADGNPHLAYSNLSGQVRHAHSIDGGPWEASVVGSSALSPTEHGVAGPSIAVDAEGVHHVAWEEGSGISYANNAEGDFSPVIVAGTETEPPGSYPRLGAGGDGILFLGWYNPSDKEVQLAVPRR